MTGRPRGDAGSAPIELVLLAVPAMALVALVVVGGRQAIARDAVQAAAAEAARAASISRTADQAQSAAESGVSAILATEELECAPRSVDLDTSGFAAPVGTPALVRATVTCDVALTDLSLLPVPGAITVTATMSSPLDTYRSRG